MNFLPQASGARPRVACEITPQAVVAARAETAAAPLSAVARLALAAGAVAPSLKPGNIVDRLAVVNAMRKTLEDIGFRTGSRADMTLVIPDAAVRVLLLDFDALPSKLTEALPLVRFRLKKLLPFDADDAMISFQIMSSSKQMVRVLAVAIPPDVLAEYESAAREAGFEPGAVLPSTLACVGSLESATQVDAALIVSAHPHAVTTAIVRNNILLLHRSVDLGESSATVADADTPIGLAATDVDLPHISVVPESMRQFAEDVIYDRGLTVTPIPADSAPPEFQVPAADDPSRDIAEAVNVAAAYYEDTLAQAPSRILSAGTVGADALERILTQYGVAQTDGLHVRELVTPEDMAAGAVTASVPRGALAGVLGALRG